MIFVICLYIPASIFLHYMLTNITVKYI